MAGPGFGLFCQKAAMDERVAPASPATAAASSKSCSMTRAPAWQFFPVKRPAREPLAGHGFADQSRAGHACECGRTHSPLKVDGGVVVAFAQCPAQSQHFAARPAGEGTLAPLFGRRKMQFVNHGLQRLNRCGVATVCFACRKKSGPLRLDDPVDDPIRMLHAQRRHGKARHGRSSPMAPSRTTSKAELGLSLQPSIFSQVSAWLRRGNAIDKPIERGLLVFDFGAKTGGEEAAFPGQALRCAHCPFLS